VFVTARSDPSGLRVELAGDWRRADLPQIQQELAAVLPGARGRVTLACADLHALDAECAAVLRDFLASAREAGASIEFDGAVPQPLQQLDPTLKSAADAQPEPAAAVSELSEPVEAIGRQTVRLWHDLVSGLAFIGRVSAMFGLALRSLRRLRPISIARHVYDTGVTAIPIVSLIAFLISVIVAYMGAQQLRKFGADIFVVDLVTVGVLREMGVLLTAIIVAGRSGSAFAAEIGAMKLNEEVDALNAMGVEPIEVLILPRIFGLVIALPLLAVIADAIGLTGGALLCKFLLDMPLTQYLSRTQEAMGPMTFWVGIIKAPVFALLIALAGTYHGLQVRGSSRDLGRLTTVAVVQSIFLVILADALFAVLFMELDI
jgi:phospholipid/cholesterol/gamma-HCH transport system permease protein